MNRILRWITTDLVCQSLRSNAAWATSRDCKKQGSTQLHQTYRKGKTNLTVDHSASQTPVGELDERDDHEEDKLGCHLGILSGGHGLEGGHRNQDKAGYHLGNKGAAEHPIDLLHSAVSGRCRVYRINRLELNTHRIIC